MGLQSGPVSRTRSSQRRYVVHKKASKPAASCEFCAFTSKSPQFVKKEKQFKLIKNIFYYDLWDGCKVKEHLMLVPTRHVQSLGELTREEKATYGGLVAKYEASGYSLYSRAPDNITKSVPHQHTHLIKLEPRRQKFLLYLRKPHLLIFR